MSFYVWGCNIMKPTLAGIPSVCLSAGRLAIFRLPGIWCTQHYILLDWLGYWWLISCADLNCYLFCYGKQLCLAVSLISTAANSAWDGEFRVECGQQGCAGSVVGWQEGTDGKREGRHFYAHCCDKSEALRSCVSWCFLLRMIHPRHVMSLESSESF